MGGLVSEIYVGNTQQVQSLLNESPDLVNEKGEDGRTALHHAAAVGSEKVVEMLLSRMDQDAINAVDYAERTALHLAAFEGHEGVVNLLLQKAPKLVGAVDNNGWTVLHGAAAKGKEKVVDLLLQKAPKLVDAVDNNGWTALRGAAWKDYDKVVDLLLKKPPKPIYAIGNNGDTALHRATANDHKKVVEMLLPRTSPETIAVVVNDGNTEPHLKIIMQGYLASKQAAGGLPADSAVIIHSGTSTETKTERLEYGLDQVDQIKKALDNKVDLNQSATERQKKKMKAEIVELTQFLKDIKGKVAANDPVLQKIITELNDLIRAKGITYTLVDDINERLDKLKNQKLEYGLDQIDQIKEALDNKVDLSQASERQKKKMKAEIVELELTLKDIKDKVAVNDPVLKKILTEINDLMGAEDIRLELVDDINEQLDNLKKQKPVGNGGAEACYYVKEIIYDNELLNHPKLFNKLANIYGANKVLDLSSQMSPELLHQAIESDLLGSILGLD